MAFLIKKAEGQSPGHEHTVACSESQRADSHSSLHLSSEEDAVQPRAENPGNEADRSPEESSLPARLSIEQSLLGLNLGDELVRHFLDLDAEFVEPFL